MLQLRNYQQLSLDRLRDYLERATRLGAGTAFYDVTKRAYRDVERLPGLPYVCLRVPTGGGKTLMACHAVGIAAESFLQAERAVCLWLVPSNTIREQTLDALRHRQHPYRQVLDADFGGKVRVIDISQALSLQRATLDGETVVVVSTMQALRREETEGLKVYEASGTLQHHFSGLSDIQARQLESVNGGPPPYSLCNVLRLRRPMVIVDEAHNARTPLSFDTLARFSPSCIIEFTATPQTKHDPDDEVFASNVLHHVSAAELKTAEMIKLPIKLRTHGDPREVIGAALARQVELERIAGDEQAATGEYIRPIVLFQAQSRSAERETLTADVLKQTLIGDFHVPENQIAIATGQTREIGDVDLFSSDCPIRFIITVKALSEGWDCSFAYVLCTVAESRSERAVEQILGRILRLPRARWKKHADLNCAYAFAASERFFEVASSLRDALIQNGFQRMEASDFITPDLQQVMDLELGTLWGEVSETLPEKPELSGLSASLRDRVVYDAGTAQLTVQGALSESDHKELRGTVKTKQARAVIDVIAARSRGRAAVVAIPAPLRVPMLAIRVDGQLELFEKEHFLATDWNVAQCDASLSDVEFPSLREGGSEGQLDVSNAGRVELTQFVATLHQQLELLEIEQGWDVASLANWLDRKIPHKDIPQAYSSLFIHNVLTGLMKSRGMTVELLARDKFRLRNVIEAKIGEHREAQEKRAYQAMLFGNSGAELSVTPEIAIEQTADNYAPNWYYDGPVKWQKSCFARVGELKSDGEEHDCAVFLDSMPEVKRWVRNIAKGEHSFWLQTATDRFYPDFVGELMDGRILVVEPKGEHLWGAPDAEEKRKVGELWADRSNGQCLFVMPKGTNWGEIEALVNTTALRVIAFES